MSQPLITRRTFALLVGGAGALSCAASAAPGATVWRLATGYPAENFHTANLLAMAKEVERSTAGQLRIEIHAGNSLFALNAIRAAVQDGKIEAGEAIMSSLAADVPTCRWPAPIPSRSSPAAMPTRNGSGVSSVP
jgi:TRAP-type C4-dicarboxylate transport system substrate-binding protein